mmetsp:Transcript_28865/g.67114  ORF Transcript_28865/g.67114 Transcript_28865/m.67114 type:complete len:309 (+) Transcript_28865:1-927(+)
MNLSRVSSSSSPGPKSQPCFSRSFSGFEPAPGTILAMRSTKKGTSSRSTPALGPCWSHGCSSSSALAASGVARFSPSPSKKFSVALTAPFLERVEFVSCATSKDVKTRRARSSKSLYLRWRRSSRRARQRALNEERSVCSVSSNAGCPGRLNGSPRAATVRASASAVALTVVRSSRSTARPCLVRAWNTREWSLAHSSAEAIARCACSHPPRDLRQPSPCGYSFSRMPRRRFRSARTSSRRSVRARAASDSVTSASSVLGGDSLMAFMGLIAALRCLDGTTEATKAKTSSSATRLSRWCLATGLIVTL